MKTVNDIELERLGTVWGALWLFIMVLFGGLFFGSVSLYIWAVEITNGVELLYYPLLVVMIFSCIFPGLVVWKLLRKKYRNAALYGFILADAVILVVPILLGVPFASSPI